MERYGKLGDRCVAHSANNLFWDFLTDALSVVVIWLGLGFVLPVILSMLGVETFILEIPDTPLSLYQYQRVNERGFLSSIQFINVLALSSAVGLIYGFVKSSFNSKKRNLQQEYSEMVLLLKYAKSKSFVSTSDSTKELANQ